MMMLNQKWKDLDIIFKNILRNLAYTDKHKEFSQYCKELELNDMQSQMLFKSLKLEAMQTKYKMQTKLQQKQLQHQNNSPRIAPLNLNNNTNKNNNNQLIYGNQPILLMNVKPGMKALNMIPVSNSNDKPNEQQNNKESSQIKTEHVKIL